MYLFTDSWKTIKYSWEILNVSRKPDVCCLAKTLPKSVGTERVFFELKDCFFLLILYHGLENIASRHRVY